MKVTIEDVSKDEPAVTTQNDPPPEKGKEHIDEPLIPDEEEEPPFIQSNYQSVSSSSNQPNPEEPDIIDMSFKYLTPELIFERCSCITGLPATGKSNLVKALMMKFHTTFDAAICFCPTIIDETGLSAYDFLPIMFVSKTVNINMIKLLKKTQTNPQTKRNLVMIFDDVTGNTNFHGELEAEFADLFSRSRHYHITVLFVAHYMKKIPPALREMMTTLFVFNSSADSLEVLRELGQSRLQSAKFKRMIYPLFENNGFALFRRNDPKFTNKVVSCKAPLVLNCDFKMWFTDIYNTIC